MQCGAGIQSLPIRLNAFVSLTFIEDVGVGQLHEAQLVGSRLRVSSKPNGRKGQDGDDEESHGGGLRILRSGLYHNSLYISDFNSRLRLRRVGKRFRAAEVVPRSAGSDLPLATWSTWKRSRRDQLRSRWNLRSPRLPSGALRIRRPIGLPTLRSSRPQQGNENPSSTAMESPDPFWFAALELNPKAENLSLT